MAAVVAAFLRGRRPCDGWHARSIVTIRRNGQVHGSPRQAWPAVWQQRREWQAGAAAPPYGARSGGNMSRPIQPRPPIAIALAGALAIGLLLGGSTGRLNAQTATV